MRIVAGIFCGFGGLLLGAFTGGVIALVVLAVTGDGIPPLVLGIITGLPAILFSLIGAVFGFVVSTGADEFGLKPPTADDADSPFGQNEVTGTGHQQQGGTFLDADPAPSGPLTSDGMIVAELVNDGGAATPPKYPPSRIAPPMYPPRPAVNATPPRPPRRWPTGWSVTGIVMGVLAVAPAVSAVLVTGQWPVLGGCFAAVSAMLFLPGLLCMATAIWGDFTKAKVVRAGKAGVVSGLLFNGGSYLAAAFVAVSVLHAGLLPPTKRVRDAQLKLREARDERVASARRLRLAAAPVVSPVPLHGGGAVPRPRPATRPSTRPATRPGGGLAERPASIAVRLPAATAKETAVFAEKPNTGTRSVIQGATFTAIGHVNSTVSIPPVWSASGKQFYTVEGNGTVRRISSDDLLQTHEIKFDGQITGMTLTQKGLIIARHRPGDFTLLEPTSLRPLKRYIVPGIHDVAGGKFSETFYLSVRSPRRGSPPGGFLFNLETQEAFPQAKPIQGTWFGMTPQGDFLLTGDSSQLRRYGVGRETLKLHQTSGYIGSSPRNIDMSPDGQYVALPSGGGNRATGGAARLSYGTYLFKIEDLAEPVAAVSSGAYPRTISVDPASKIIYAQKSSVPLMSFSPEGVRLRTYTGGPLPRDSDRIIASPKGGQLLLVGSGRITHAVVPAEKLPGADVFDSRVEPPEELDLRAPPLPEIQPAAWKGAAKTVLLPAAINSVTAAAGGRYYLLYLGAVGQIAVFDVEAAEVIRYLEVGAATASGAPADGTTAPLLIAGAGEYFVTVDPASSTISRWSLRSFKLEKIETLGPALLPYAAAMGAAGNGPLLVAAGSGHHLYDLQTLLPVKLEDTAGYLKVKAGPATRVRASSNGRVFASNAGSLREANAMLRFEVQSGRVISKAFPASFTSVALPDYDGSTIFSSRGQFSSSWHLERTMETRDAAGPRSVVLPSVRGDFHLKIRVPKNQSSLPAAGSEADLATQLQLVTFPGRGITPVEVGDLEDGRKLLLAYNTYRIKPEQLGLPIDQRFFISAPAGIYGYVPLSGDRIEVRKLRVEPLLEKRTTPYLFILSTPPATIRAGTELTYQLKVLTNSPGLTYSTQKTIPGLKISTTGKLTWKLPASLTPGEKNILIQAEGNGVSATQNMRIVVTP